MAVTLILCVIGAVSLFLYVKEKIGAYSVRAVMLKSLVSVIFIGTALSASATSEAGYYGALITGGLGCGLLGDIWLDLKFIYPADDEVYTYAGFKSFFAGHILYMLGMILRYGDFSRPGYIIVPLLMGVAGGFITGAAAPVLKLDYGKFKRIVVIYGAALFAMVFLAGSLAIMNGFAVTTLNVMTAGGVLFAASDLILSGTYFGVGKDRPIDLILNYFTYYPAQFLIAVSLLFVI